MEVLYQLSYLGGLAPAILDYAGRPEEGHRDRSFWLGIVDL
jgi:hypothetical protein